MGNGLSLYRCPNSVGQLESRGLHGSCFLKVFRIMVLNIWTQKVYINNFELLEVFNIEALVNDVKLSCSKSIELVFELVRQRYFPGKPSRMTSLCAVDNPEARGWKSLKADEKQLFEIIAPDDTPSFDGAFLHGGLALNRDSFENWKIDFSISELFDLAYAYWSGESTSSPQYEYLVQLPIAQIHLVHAS